MITEDAQTAAFRAATGRQLNLTIDPIELGLAAGTDLQLVGVALPGGAGKTYLIDIPVAGNQSCTVVLTPSALTGAVTARIYGTYLDGSPFGTPVSLSPALAAGTQSSASLSSLICQRVRLEITVPAAGSITLQQAESISL